LKAGHGNIVEGARRLASSKLSPKYFGATRSRGMSLPRIRQAGRSKCCSSPCSLFRWASSSRVRSFAEPLRGRECQFTLKRYGTTRKRLSRGTLPQYLDRMCVRRGRLAGRSEFRGVLQAVLEKGASQRIGSLKVQADLLSFG